MVNGKNLFTLISHNLPHRLYWWLRLDFDGLSCFRREFAFDSLIRLFIWLEWTLCLVGLHLLLVNTPFLGQYQTRIGLLCDIVSTNSILPRLWCRGFRAFRAQTWWPMAWEARFVSKGHLRKEVVLGVSRRVVHTFFQLTTCLRLHRTLDLIVEGEARIRTMAELEWVIHQNGSSRDSLPILLNDLSWRHHHDFPGAWRWNDLLSIAELLAWWLFWRLHDPMIRSFMIILLCLAVKLVSPWLSHLRQMILVKRCICGHHVSIGIGLFILHNCCQIIYNLIQNRLKR